MPGSCTKTHRQITLASDMASSMSFFHGSRLPSPKPLKQIPVDTSLVFDASKSYIAILTSDGDNLAYDYGATRDLMAARVALCSAMATAADCPPISWTLSPRLPELEPAQAEWYYEQAALTKRDSFLFGPSGCTRAS